MSTSGSEPTPFGAPSDEPCVRISILTDPDPQWAVNLKTFGDHNLYVGSPIFVGGLAVGALCAFIAGERGAPPPDEVEERLGAVLKEHAAQVGAIFERFIERDRARSVE